MLDIFKFRSEDKIKYMVIIFGLLLFWIVPYSSYTLHGVFSIILVGLGSYFWLLKGGLIASLWMVFIQNFWGSPAVYNIFYLLAQGVVFGGLFEYQANLKQKLAAKGEYFAEKKEMFDKILETTIDGFFMLDKKGGFIKVNQAYQKMLGYSKERLLEMELDDICVLKSKGEINKALTQVMTFGKDKYESWHQAKDGSIINLEITATYLDDIKDGVFVCFGRDITIRKEKEQQLKVSEAKFRSYIENAPYGIVVVNSAGIYTEVNPKACEISGDKAQDILGSKIGRVGSTLDTKKAQALFEELKEKGQAQKELVFQQDSKTKVDVEVNAVKINEDKYIGFAEDITQRKEVERKIKSERDKLKKYFEITQAIVMRLDINKEVKEINKNGCKIIGYERKEVIGKNWINEFVKKEDRDKTEYVFKKAYQDKEVINGENTIITKSGAEKDIFWNSNILTDQDDKVTGILTLGVDLTEIKSLREELEYSKLQVQFFSNLSHELKTPLNLIFSAHQMLELEQNKLPADKREKFAQYLDVIAKNGNRLLRLVNNILDMHKFESDDFTLDVGNYDLVKVVENVAFSIREYIEQKGRKFEFNSELESQVLSCDPFHIERVLLNLLSNAIKFSEKGDKIEIKLIDLEEQVRLVVEDTGIGIPESKQNLIFKRFGQVDKSFTRNNEGSGIGLSIVELIVNAHGGDISVDSQQGLGSKFIIDLPVTTNIEAPANLQYNSQQLVDRIDREFSDIYN